MVAGRNIADAPWFLEKKDRVNRAIQGTQDLDRMMYDVLNSRLTSLVRPRLAYPCNRRPSWRG
jgi:hypothetical protein